MADQAKTPKGSNKLKGIAKNRAMYATQFITTEKNKRRTLIRHIRENPLDLKAAQIGLARFGWKPNSLGVSSRGRKTVFRQEMRLRADQGPLL